MLIPSLVWMMFRIISDIVLIIYMNAYLYPKYKEEFILEGVHPEGLEVIHVFIIIFSVIYGISAGN